MADVLDFSAKAKPAPLDFSSKAEPAALDFSAKAVPHEPVFDFSKVAPEAIPPSTTEELAARRWQLMQQTGLQLEGQPAFHSVGELLTTPHPLLPKAIGVGKQQFADAIDALAISGAQAEGAITADEAQEALADKSRTPTKVESFLAGAQQAAADSVNFFTTPLGIAVLGTGGAPAAIRKTIAGAFTADMARQYPAMVRELSSSIKDKDPERIGKALTGMGLNTAFIAEGLKSVFAGKAIESVPAEPKEATAPQPPPETAEAIKHVESKIQFETPPDERTLAEKAVAAKERGINLFVDDLRPLEVAEKAMAGGKLAEGEASPTKVARITTQSSGARAREWATEGMTDFAGNKIGPSLKEIFGREGVAGDEKAAMKYAVSMRAIELAQRGIDSGIEPAKAVEAVQWLQTPARQRFAAEVRDWNESALQYLADAGGVSPESLARITKLNQSYIPFFRVFEEQGKGFSVGGRRIGDTPNPLKSIKGSERQIINPIDSMLQHANQIIAVADKVRVARSLVNLAEKGDFEQWVRKVPPDKVPVQFDIERVRKQLQDAGVTVPEEVDAMLTIWRNSPRKPVGENIVGFVRDGKPQYYELHPELYRAVQALDYHRIHPLMDILFGKAARTIRLGATGVRAGFTLLTNPIRDFPTMLLQSVKNPARAASMWGKHLAKQIGLKDSEIKELWKATGGEIAQPLGLDRRSLKAARDEVMANSVSRVAMGIVKHPFETARRVLSFTEAAPRLAEFEMTLRDMGWKPGQRVTPDMAVEAALRAAEVTVNFKRGGAWGRMWNQATAFFNPAVQGLSKFSRSHQDNPKRSIARGLSLMTLPAVANWWMNKDDPEWKNLPPWVKYGFLNFKIGGEWMRFPMPFEWWYAYGALPLATLEAIDQKEPLKLRLAMKELAQQAMPPTIPSVAVPFWEIAQNKSMFTGKPLVPEAQQRLLPHEQSLPGTSETAKKVAEILSTGGVEVSPIHVDHILSGETGGFLRDVISTTERLGGFSPQRENMEPADFPVAGRLFIRDNASAVIDEFYTELEHVRQKDATYKKLLRQEPGRAERYRLTPDESRVLGYGNKVEKTLSIMRQQYRDAETREERKEIFDRMEKLAGRAIGKEDE